MIANQKIKLGLSGIEKICYKVKNWKTILKALHEYATHQFENKNIKVKSFLLTPIGYERQIFITIRSKVLRQIISLIGLLNTKKC